MIDSDLFQTIALALLFLILLVQLIQLALLNRMRQSGETPSVGHSALDEPASSLGSGTATSSYGGAGSYEPAGYGGGTGYGAGVGSYGGYTGAATTAAPATTASPRGTTTPTETAPVTEARQEVATSYVPLEQAAPAAQTPEASSGTAMLSGDEPEEQPFERDGRWWFKRGGELLVYDEGTGQWVAAPGGGYGATTGGVAAPATETTATGPASGSDPGEGWRCASCGAINGSTATVCRMCFTPRA